MNLSTKVFKYLTELKTHNNREWFMDQKLRFNEIQKELIHYTASLLSGLEAFDPSLRGVDPKSCIFRIYKDVRFSKEKEFYASKVETVPRGFSKDHPMIEFLKYKGYAVVKKLKNAEVTSINSTETFLKDFRILYPLNLFLEELMR
ncbi:DUF2461 family protein [Leptospira sp. WS39.C2]